MSPIYADTDEMFKATSWGPNRVEINLHLRKSAKSAVSLFALAR
jgi:hypothetical protein